jgi:hypothetical protein
MPAPAVRQFAGDIRFWELDSNGDPIPVIPDATDATGNQPIECNTLNFGYEAGDEQKVISKRRDARYNQPIHSETLPGTTQVSATLLELPPLILARILFGEGSTATVVAGSVADATLAVPTVDLPIQLPHRMLLATPVPVVEKNNVALVAGTDYVIDLRRGQIKFKGAAVDAGDTDITISYSYGAHVSTHIVGGATPTKKFYITGDMEDRVSHENGELRIPQVNLSVNGDVDWLSAEPIQAEMTGDAVIAAGESAPYTFTLYKAA